MSTTLRFALLVAVFFVACLSAFAGVTTRVSVSGNGTQGNNASYDLPSARTGAMWRFDSQASNLVSSGTNGHGDVFVYDRQTGVTELVSVASDGTPGNSWMSILPSARMDAMWRLRPLPTIWFPTTLIVMRISSFMTGKRAQLSG